MKKICILLLFALLSISANAQYNTMTPRDDYKSAFSGTDSNFCWSRTCETELNRSQMIVEIAKHITITTVVENMVIGKIEDWTPGTFASMSNGLLPWDGSTIKADVTYILSDSGYIVTASRIYFLNEALDKSYFPVYSFIYNKYGDLRKRGDGDLRYFDNAFCDILILE